MKPKHRNRRLGLIIIFGALLIAGTLFLMSALQQNTQFFYNPSETKQRDFSAQSERIRIGGLVVPGSIEQTGDLTITFDVVDFVEGLEVVPDDMPRVQVIYTGVVPDLFKEGKGVVVGGTFNNESVFEAREVLAKHDENYQPKKEY